MLVVCLRGHCYTVGVAMKPAPIHPWRWRALAVWCVAFTVVVAWGLNKVDTTAKENRKAREVLCIRQATLRKEVNRSLQYLQDVHEGKRKPVPGISDADILIGVNESRVEIISYNPLHCKQGG